MTISVKAYANADDVLIAWQPDSWPINWVGFQLERRNNTTQQVTTIANRIPPHPGQGPVQPTGLSSQRRQSADASGPTMVRWPRTASPTASRR
jgi:hypothetical protein